MAFTNSEKVILAKAAYKADTPSSTDLYIALGIGSTELSGNGYSRGRVQASQLTINATTGVISIASGITIYTANTASAQTSTHSRLARSASGSDWVTTTWVAHNAISAPMNGQSVVTGASMTLSI